MLNNKEWIKSKLSLLKLAQEANDEGEIFKLIEDIAFYNIIFSQQKPSWDKYFLNLAKIVSSRSIDPSTRHGCVIVDENKHVISIGYNGPVKGMDDSKIPMTRPLKYLYMSHSEQNGIMFCQSSMKNSTVYVTGRPCAFCTRMLIQKDVARVAYGNITSKCVDAEDQKAADDMIKQSKTIFEQIEF